MRLSATGFRYDSAIKGGFKSMVHDQNGLKRIRAEVKTHLIELEHILSETSSYSEEDPENNRIVLRAYGSLLHDFYTGIESIFQIIASEIDGSQPTTSDWHRRLILGMTVELEDVRPPVITGELSEMLDPYRGFRHIFRNVYGRRLYWERMHMLVQDMPELFRRFSEEIESFFTIMKAICPER